MSSFQRRMIGVSCLAGLASTAGTVLAGTATFDFTTDPTLDANPIRVYQSGFADSSGTSIYWKDAGGNPGGFLGVCWPLAGSTTIAVFPDIDDGKLVTAFKFECDLRVGNPMQQVRPADGFSVNFARRNDPVFQVDPPSANEFATAGAVETGTTTGIAICFDTWAGNTLPDGADIEGIIVRVDNKTVLRQAMPTRNGECDDATSLQTGPRDAQYWADANANGTMPDAAFLPESWETLCWQQLSVEVDSNAQLTVIYKGQTVLDHYQTTYFPSAGGLVLAGRTGGADEHTHFDNVKLTTTAVAADTENPTVPANLRVLETGALRAVITWDPSTDNSGRVGYEIEQDGTALPTTFVLATNDIRNLSATTTYSFRVRATDVSGNKSDWSAPLSVTTVALVEDAVYGTAKIYGTVDEPIAGTDVPSLLGDARYPDSPSRTAPINGMQFGEPLFGDTYGENHGVRIAGTVTPPVSGDYHFFVRSDDASQLWLNTAGAAIPDPFAEFPIAEETGCCEAFKEQTDPPTDQPFETTTTPITLQAGQSYGILFLVKEGGGGDWGQVAWRRVGDNTPATSLSAIGYPAFTPETKAMVDPVGAVATINTQPQSVTTPANESVSFNVNATTASPYSSTVIYQWFRNGTAIAGANTATYTIPVASMDDNGAKYTVLVAVQGKSVTSSEATLTVTADNKAPTVVGTASGDTFDQVTLRFSEPVTAPSATTAGNYAINNGVTVSAATLVNPNTVRLTTSAQTPATAYTVTINNVADNAGNTVAAGSTASFTSYEARTGEVTALFYTNLGGTAVANLTGASKFPGSPDETRYITSLSSPDGYGENYGVMLRGFISPTQSGSYHFFLRSDDASALYLNKTGANPPEPGTATLIAEETGCCGAFMEPGDPRTTVDPIALTAGQRYGFTVLMKEGGGGDYVQVAWRLDSDFTPADQLQPIGAQFLGTFAPAEPDGEATIAISRTGTAISIEFTGTLESSATVDGDFSAVAGATSPYTPTATDAQRYFRSRQ